jgi:hypothetical protein
MTCLTTPDADLADAIAACPTYLAPLNSIGAGGVCFSALESFEWMPLETAADLRAVVARLRCDSIHDESFESAPTITRFPPANAK